MRETEKNTGKVKRRETRLKGENMGIGARREWRNWTLSMYVYVETTSLTIRGGTHRMSRDT